MEAIILLLLGTLNLHIPFLSYLQRGGKLKFTYTLYYTGVSLAPLLSN
jgi:hypothetical protein